jgi:prevent-host-death family protein
MTDVGLREMRQHASDLVRRAQAGEHVTITVAGRPAAVLGPAPRSAWRSWDEIGDLFQTPTDPTWPEDRELIDQTLTDPWEGR